MSATRRRPMHSRSRSSRRKLVWATRNTAASVTANGQVTNIDLLQEYKALTGASSAGITIIRTHLMLWPTGTVTNGDSFEFGLKVDDIDQVVASSASALAVSPTGNPNTDWMFLNRYQATPTYGTNASNNNISLDLKAKRRMEELQQAFLFSITPIGVAAGGLPFTFEIWTRALLALP